MGRKNLPLEFSCLAALVSGIHKNYPKGPEKDLDIAENDGNAAIKDLLINATTPVPSKFEGPQIQDRSVGDPDYTLKYHESY